MNKRNFFKGLMALLAMPGNIYAKVFSKAKQPKFPYLFDSTVGTFAKEVKLDSFEQVRAGMLFTTWASWGRMATLFEVVEVGLGYAFVTPRKSITNPEWLRWPSGMSRKLDFQRARLSEFTFYART